MTAPVTVDGLAPGPSQPRLADPLDGSTPGTSVPPGPDPAPAGDVAASRVRVLVVDDSLDHRELMLRRLREAGMRASGAATATEALEAADDVDLVVLDLRLPGTDGLEVLTALLGRAEPPSVVMVTAAGSTETAVEAMRSGAAYYLSKEPGYLDALPEVVARAWEHHDLERRSGTLQRAALSLTGASDLAGLAREIAATARRLARAGSVRVEVGGGEGVGVARAELGSPPLDGSPLTLTLPGDQETPGGRVELWPAVPLAAGDHDLLRAFAALAGSALGNLVRLELQRRLVRELRRTLDARQDFIASISHELRTPLTAIAGFSATLQTHGARLEDDRRDDLLLRIRRNAEELGGLVDELLELASLERGSGGEAVLGPIDLRASAAAVLSELAPVLSEHEVEVTLDDVEVQADARLLRRTLANLLTNAAKFSPPDAPITLRSRVEDDEVRVEVVDRGVGLEPFEARHVFDAFYRTSSSVSDAVRGSGIGLALVARYLAAMGGEVGVSSTPGQGSTFWFRLPRA